MAVLARWVSPWSRFTELQRESDQLMRDVLAGLGSYGGVQGASSPVAAEHATSWMPAVDVLTRDNDIVVRAELSGVDPSKDIDISVHDGMLTIRGERRMEDHQDNGTYVRLERRYGAFERTLPIPEGVNADAIQAEYRDGVLQVVIPGAAKVPSVRRVPVQIANGSTETIEADRSSQHPAVDHA